MGKTIGDDFREGKITLPVLAAYQAGSPVERAFWSRTIESLEQQESDLDHALVLMQTRGAIGITFDRARRFAEDAKRALAGFPPSAMRTALLDVADFTVSRIS